jgi:hypothetical protein
MNISSLNSPSDIADLAISMRGDAVSNEKNVLMLKKAQDLMKQEGAAFVKMIESSGAPSQVSSPGGLDVYA